MVLTPRQHNCVSYFSTIVMYCLAAHSTHRSARWTQRAEWAIALWSLHFLRRGFESLCVHVYSKPLVPALDTLFELSYYWGFGAWTAYCVGVRAGDAFPVNMSGVGLWAFAECMNSLTHWQLAALRRGGGGGVARNTRVLPSLDPRCGMSFSWVACPHYTFEVLSWIGFNIAVGLTVGGGAFALLGALIVTMYARERHAAYRADFGKQYTVRCAILPGVL
jgi:hypothetical protein